MNPRTQAIVLLIAGAFTLAGMAERAHCGDLYPPPGPVTPTMKPLSDVEPRIAVNAVNTPGDADSVFKITQPGSYYLTSPVTGVAGKHGIEIAAGSVTLDLMGFSLAGVPGSLSGILGPTQADTLTIRQGTVRGWGGAGIDLATGGLRNAVIEGVHAVENGGAGMQLAFLSALVRGCTARENGSSGFLAVHNTVFESCAAESNGGDGIRAVGHSGTVRSCVSAYNTGAGIYAEEGWTVVQCSVSWNGTDGIQLLYGGTITDCTVMRSGGNGISGGKTVSNCTSTGNTGHGIVVSGGGLVLSNTSASNQAAGIHVGGSTGDARIEGNNVFRNAVGIDVDFAGNVIVRNTASGNTANNYDIVAGNRYGPILNITSSATAAALGNSAVSTMSTTDPWANFSY